MAELKSKLICYKSDVEGLGSSSGPASGFRGGLGSFVAKILTLTTACEG
jgi:hypothetical protein